MMMTTRAKPVRHDNDDDNDDDDDDDDDNDHDADGNDDADDDEMRGRGFLCDVVVHGDHECLGQDPGQTYSRKHSPHSG